MTPIKQRNKHNPENGIWGDCHRACIASLLDMQMDQVPHFGEGGPDGEEFDKREREFLLKCDLVPIRVAYLSEGVDRGNLDLIFNTVSTHNPDTYFILGGISKNNTNHSVVCLNREIVHDPNGAGIAKPFDDGFYWVTFLGSIRGLRYKPLKPKPTIAE